MKIKGRENAANIVSAIALLFSMIAIFFLLKDNFYFSFAFILLALVFDALDGYVARSLKIDSKFGSAMDGYVDVVNYLIYPSLFFFIYFKMTHITSLLAIFIFVLCGIYRLARFQISGIKKSNNKMYYEGLPVFISPILILVYMFILNFLPIWFNFLFVYLLLVTSILMVQTFKFPKPKNIFLYILLISFLGFLFIVKGF